jgi:ribose transport system substrate-binding protein
MNLTREVFWLVWALGIICLTQTGDAMAEQIGHSKELSLAEMQQVVAKASKRTTRWEGPKTGPAGRPGMRVAVICEDLRNGGVLGVAKGVSEAAEVMGWQVKIFDAHGTPKGRTKELAAVLAMVPDGVILLGSDARIIQSSLQQLFERSIPLVGWHVGPKAGTLTSGSVAINVSTDPLEVARVTAMAAIVDAREPLGAVIFTDPNFDIAMTKANAMAHVIRQCKECTLLEMLEVPISGSARLVPKVTRQLLARYGTRLTHALAINDIYFDYAVPELTKSGSDIRLFSAGDGSPAAFLRIQAGTLQFGTVAKPLNLHGWQLVDELNRLLAGQQVSGYIDPVHLVTSDNIAYDGGLQMLYDPDNGYREAYQRIWMR